MAGWDLSKKWGGGTKGDKPYVYGSSATNKKKRASEVAQGNIDAYQQQINQLRAQQFSPSESQLERYSNLGGETGRKQDLEQFQSRQNEQIKALEAKINAERMAAQGLNPDGSPMAPEWESLIDPSTGKLRKEFQAELAGLDPTTWEGYSKFKGEALREGPSVWANLQMQKQAAEELAQKEAAAKQGMAALSQGLGQLSMRGGLSGASRGRLAQQGMRDILAQKQQTGRQAMLNRLGISTTDEERRQQQLGQLMASEQDLGKFNKQLEGQVMQFNLNNLLRDIEGQRAHEMGTYQEQQKKWAAERQAQATERSGGGGK